MPSPEQLAGWACHTLAPHLQTLAVGPEITDEPPLRTSGRNLPSVTAELWLCLTQSEANSAYSARIRTTAVEALQPSADGKPPIMRLWAEIQQALEASPQLCDRLDTLMLSMAHSEG